MKLSRKIGTTSEILQVFIRDTTSTTGAGLTGLVYNSAGLTAYFHRDTDTTATVIALANMSVGTFTSSGFKEIDATNMPGWYQFCPPNAAFLSGAKSVGFHLKGASNMAPTPIEIDLNTEVDVVKVAGTTQTATDIKTQIDSVNLKSGRQPTYISVRPFGQFTVEVLFTLSGAPVTGLTVSCIRNGFSLSVTELGDGRYGLLDTVAIQGNYLYRFTASNPVLVDVSVIDVIARATDVKVGSMGDDVITNTSLATNAVTKISDRIERADGPLDATRDRVLLALPNAGPNAEDGLPVLNADNEILALVTRMGTNVITTEALSAGAVTKISDRIERDGGVLDLTRDRVLLALPADTPDSTGGLPIGESFYNGTIAGVSVSAVLTDAITATSLSTDAVSKISDRIERSGGMLDTFRAAIGNFRTTGDNTLKGYLDYIYGGGFSQSPIPTDVSEMIVGSSVTGDDASLMGAGEKTLNLHTWFGGMIENGVGILKRFTEAALFRTPSGGGGGGSVDAEAIQRIAASVGTFGGKEYKDGNIIVQEMVREDGDILVRRTTPVGNENIMTVTVEPPP
jgi:hypothetical protein